MYDEILQAVIDLAETTGASVLTGSMPPDNGVAMTGSSSTAAVYRDIGTDERMNIICNGKNVSQETAIRQLDAIHRTLTRRKDYPAGAGWQIYAIETVASPRLIGREANSQWLYGSSLLVKINMKGIECA